ncbi:MAG: hypothetical protein EA362_04980 [Saprospirales bacterium]|nr:MAG: hypothetical protein EA362_04980 [Saprospirales bacterium]
MKKLYVFTAIILVFFSCKDTDCPLAAGDNTFVEFLLDEFDVIYVSDQINIQIQQTNYSGLVIHGGENLINNIHFEVKNRELHLRNQNNCRWLRSPSERITIDIFTPEIREINFSGFGDVFMNDWELNSLSVHTLKSLRNFEFSGTADSMFFYLEQGSPDLYLSGTTHYLYVYNSGTGKVVANDLEAHFVHFNHMSTADFRVFPIETLRVEIRSSGNTIAHHKAQNVEIIKEGKGQYLEEF